MLKNYSYHQVEPLKQKNKLLELELNEHKEKVDKMALFKTEVKSV